MQKDDVIYRQAAIDGKILIQRANGVEIYSDEAVPVEYLKRLPSAEPVRHGKWIKADSQQYFRKHYPLFTCSACGYRKDSQKKWNYCPNCGCRMDEE